MPIITSAYRGNQNLKRSNVTIKFTEDQVKEYIKCSLDPIYFIETYVKVVHVDKGLIPMKLYPYQKETILTAKENRKVICKFPRQSGKSTCIAAFALHQILFNDNYNVLIAANKGKTAQEIMKKVQTSFEYLPSWLQQGIVPGGFNKSTIQLENGSRCMATSTSADSARGFSFNCVSGDSKIQIKNKDANEELTIDFVDFSNMLNKKTVFNNITNQIIHHNTNWEILTANGWSNFEGLLLTRSQKLIEIEHNGNKLKCTPQHKLIIDDKEVFARTLPHRKINGYHDVYDPINVAGKNRFLVNNIESHNCVILDEFAFLPRTVADEFFTSIYPTISSGETTRMIVISTPKGLNHFYKMFNEATSKDNDYIPLEIKWNDVPGRDDKFREEQIKNFGYDKFRQEFESEFIGSSDTLISPKKIAELTHIKEISTVMGIKIFEKPVKDRKYFITMDPSEGKNQDFHAFVVMDITERPFRVVATWKDKTMDPMLVPDVLYHAGKLYNEPFILIETKSTGTQISDGLYYEKEYWNLLGSKSAGRSGQKLTNYSKDAKGLSTSTTTKSVGCSNLRMIVEHDQIFTNDFDIKEELSHFILRNNTFKAEEGYHDDLVMCLVIFSWATTQTFFKNLSDIDMNKILDERREELKQSFLPIFSSEGVIGSDREVVDMEDDEWDNFFLS